MTHNQTATQLLNELREFAAFPAATQRYIRRSLDIGLGRRDACSIWARNPAEAAAIRTQYEVYQAIAPLRAMLPEGPAADGTESFMGALIKMSAFDLGQERLEGFSAYRFLYERLLGATVRPLAACRLLRGRRAAPDPPAAPQGPAPVDQRGGGHRPGLVDPRAHFLPRIRPARRNRLNRLSPYPTWPETPPCPKIWGAGGPAPCILPCSSMLFGEARIQPSASNGPKHSKWRRSAENPSAASA
jgi:hypothetical protein